MSDTFPDADTVARTIVAASRETGADPIMVASAVRGTKGYEISRARAYAAMALRAEYGHLCGSSAISRMVGGRGISICGQMDFQIRDGLCRWWSDEIFMRVVSVVGVAA